MTHQIILQLFILNHDFFILNQPSLHEKRRSPALNPFVWVASDVSLFQPKQKIFIELTLIDN